MITSLPFLYYYFIFLGLLYCYCFDYDFLIFAIKILKENAATDELSYEFFFLVS